MRDIRDRRFQAFGAVAVAAMLLIGAAGCGGGSSDSAGSSDGTAKTTQAGGSSDSGGDGGDAAPGLADLPDPCDLVPLGKASEILGGEASEPEATTSDVGVTTKTCVWQTQAGKDEPTLDGAGHILTLNVTAPPESMSMSDFWDASKESADEEASIPSCSAGFWMGGLLSGTVDGVYLTGSAGLADASDDAKQSTLQLVSAACESVTS